MTYDAFLKAKMVSAPARGFTVSAEDINPLLKPHQRDIVQWCVAGGRHGRGVELNPRYWLDSCQYLKAAETKVSMPTLFDALEASA